jgi:hypothetical protein
MEVSKCNPFSEKYHAIEDFKKLTVSNKVITIVLTALAFLVSFGVATTVVFRTLTEKFSISKDLKPDSPQADTAKKVDNYKRQSGNGNFEAAPEENKEEPSADLNLPYQDPDRNIPLAVKIADKELKVAEEASQKAIEAQNKAAQEAAQKEIEEIMLAAEAEIARQIEEKCLADEIKAGKKAEILHAAILAGNVEEMKTLINEGANVNFVYQGRTALQVALENLQFSAIKWLIQNGAEKVKGSSLNFTPESSIATYLFENETELTYKEFFSAIDRPEEVKIRRLGMVENFIVYFVGIANKDLAKEFFDAVHDVDFIFEGKSMLQTTLDQGFLDLRLIEMLVEKGAKKAKINKPIEGIITLEAFVLGKGGDQKTLETLLAALENPSELSYKTYQGDVHNIWLSASQAGNVQVLEMFLNNGVDLNFKIRGSSALGLALGNMKLDAVEWLLDKGAKKIGFSNIVISQNNWNEIMRFLIKQPEKFTQKHFELLLLAADNINRLGFYEEDNFSPFVTLRYLMQQAILQENIEVIEKLVKAGADVNYRYVDGSYPQETPLSLAERFGKRKAKEALEKLRDGRPVNY